MYKLMIAFALMLTASAFSANNTLTGKSAQLPETISEFLDEFETAVMAGDTNLMLLYFDKHYKAEQHDQFLGGNTTQFLNEFFCGDLKKKDGFKCVPYEKIKKMTRLHVGMDKHHQGYNVRYLIKARGVKVICEWFVSINKGLTGTMLGLVGAMG